MSFVDIAGLVRGASKGQGLGNKFLANIRESDAICQVIRAFSDPDVVHVDGKVSPERRHRDDQHRADPGRPADDREGAAAAGEGGPDSQGPERAACSPRRRQAQQVLDGGTTLFAGAGRRHRPGRLRELHLLTAKPFLYVFNVDEDELANDALHGPSCARWSRPAEAVFLDAKIESELIDLPDDEAAELLAALGQAEPGLDQLVRVGFAHARPADAT